MKLFDVRPEEREINGTVVNLWPRGMENIKEHKGDAFWGSISVSFDKDDLLPYQITSATCEDLDEVIRILQILKDKNMTLAEFIQSIVIIGYTAIDLDAIKEELS